MTKAFKYDVIQLIQCIRDRPCLWDKALESYRDRIERRSAWEEIFCAIEETYDEMSWEQKRLTGELILNKWTNIRDTFMKTLKTKMGRPKKKYQYYEHLKFLTKNSPHDESTLQTIDYDDPASMTFMKQEDQCEGESSNYITRKRSKKDYSVLGSPKKPKKDLRKSGDSAVDDNDTFDNERNDNIDYEEVNEADPRIMNEDEAFFASLLPTVVKYSEDERLEFRIEVLAVMKRIRGNKKWPVDE